MNEAQRRIITGRSDEPKLEIGDTVPVEEGVVGVVLARYTSVSDSRDEVHYIIELRHDDGDSGKR
jgi:hypothetical protein